jgi:hypothetical protein
MALRAEIDCFSKSNSQVSYSRMNHKKGPDGDQKSAVRPFGILEESLQALRIPCAHIMDSSLAEAVAQFPEKYFGLGQKSLSGKEIKLFSRRFY